MGIEGRSETVAAVVETVPHELLPPGIVTRGVASWVRISVKRDDLSSMPLKGGAFVADGKAYRIVEIETAPGNPIVGFVCSVAARSW